MFRSEADSPVAEKWMLRRLVKDSEGFMSRHLERKISLAVTRKLVETRITPNAMTLVSLGIGLVGASFFVLPPGPGHVVGSLLFWLHSVLDGCDGELARLKFAESRWGGLLDFWGDNVVHSCSFFRDRRRNLPPQAGKHSSTFGGFRRGRDAPFSEHGLLDDDEAQELRWAALHLSVVRQTVRESRVRGQIADLLARRDFIYLVVALACLRRTDWFLWMGALGAPLYFLALTGFSLKTRPATPQQIMSPNIVT